MPLQVTLDESEVPLAQAFYNDRSTPLLLVVTKAALYVPKKQWSTKDPWGIRRLPLEQVRSIELRRQTAARFVIASLLILIGAAAALTALLQLGAAPSMMLLIPLAAGIWMAFTARGRRKIRIVAEETTFRWSPPFMANSNDLRRINQDLDAVIAGCRLTGVPVKVHERSDLPPTAEEEQHGQTIAGLRNLAFRATAEELGISVKNDEPFMAIMDIGFPDGMVTIVATADGDASLYIDRGESRIGGEGIEAVRKAAIEFVETAREHSSKLLPVTDFSYPPAGGVRLYARTPCATLRGEDPYDDLHAGKGDLAPLFSAGQAVIGIWLLSLQQTPPEDAN